MSKDFGRKTGVIVGRTRGGVFATYPTVSGRSLKVMNRDVYLKAMRAAGIEVKKALGNLPQSPVGGSERKRDR